MESKLQSKARAQQSRMVDEILFHYGTTTGRHLRLAPGEANAVASRAVPSSRGGAERRCSVIEYRDGGESQRIQITAGQVEWEEPSARVHRAVNVGKRPYEQVTVFLLDRPDAEAQPTEG